ncbi:MAG: ABC transporter permease, partial [Anaerolineae bacterium]|nr:ABC transporter permease [Anaerolineae bacterium]
TSMALQVPIANLFAMSLTNPLQVFKMAAVLDLRATLDILGPAGIYAFQRYGDGLAGIFVGVLALWIVLPALLAYLRFAARGDF